MVREGLLLVLVLSGAAAAGQPAGRLPAGRVPGARRRSRTQTLAFVPKLVVVVLTLIAMGPLLGAQLVRFTQALFLAIAGFR